MAGRENSTISQAVAAGDYAIRRGKIAANKRLTQLQLSHGMAHFAAQNSPAVWLTDKQVDKGLKELDNGFARVVWPTGADGNLSAYDYSLLQHMAADSNIKMVIVPKCPTNHWYADILVKGADGFVITERLNTRADGFCGHDTIWQSKQRMASMAETLCRIPEDAHEDGNLVAAYVSGLGHDVKPQATPMADQRQLDAETNELQQAIKNSEQEIPKFDYVIARLADKGNSPQQTAAYVQQAITLLREEKPAMRAERLSRLAMLADYKVGVGAAGAEDLRKIFNAGLGMVSQGQPAAVSDVPGTLFSSCATEAGKDSFALNNESNSAIVASH